MPKRKIIEIDRALCNGCGLCTTACAEGALKLDEENKAVLVRELYCDGMGACLDVCPTGDLKIIERDGEAYDAQAAYEHVLKARGREAARHVHGIAAGRHSDAPGRRHDHRSHSGGCCADSRPAAAAAAPLACGCPGSQAREIKRKPAETPAAGVPAASELGQWPIQMHLVSPAAPYFRNADLLVAADCTAFALGSFHGDLLKGRKLVIACPKLDDKDGYLEKLAGIIKANDLRSLTVAVMTVPCCGGLWRLVEEAVELAGSPLVPHRVVIGIDGRIAG